MTNSVIYTTAHTQQRSNRKSRKRKRLAEITGSSKPPKHALTDATSSKCRQPYPLIPTPPLTEELTARKAADTVSHDEHYNCDHIWDLIRESKVKQYPSNLCLANLCPATMNAKDDSTIITTTAQPRKEDQKFAEQVLHPRWIAIQRSDRAVNPLSVIQKIGQKALDGDSESIQQPPNLKSIIGDELFANINEGYEVLISKLRFLKKSQASEPQWGARLWRRWFFKDSIREPDDKPSDLKPFMGQIVQAQMSLASGGAVLPPLLASLDNRRESGLVVAPVPWHPNLDQKGNHILRYPDYLYAVSQSSLRLDNELANFRVDKLPAFRLAQYKYLPANWIAEIKSENTAANHLAAEHYCAFMSAYLLHERLLLHWIAKNESIKSNNPVEFNDDLAVYCITCCGPACRIWRTSIRTKEINSDLEPVRYDMRLLDDLDLDEDDGGQRLCDWINALNALALTVQFEGIITDLKGIKVNESRLPPGIPNTYSWTSKVGFVYSEGSVTEIRVAPLSELRKAYNNGDIKTHEQIGDKVIVWDEEGQPLEVDITGKGEQVPEPGAPFALPGAPYALPGAPSALPGASSALPGASSALPGTSSALPASSTLPGASSALPASATLPGASTALPGTSSALPGASSALPGALPGASSALPGAPSALPGASSALPGASSALPGALSTPPSAPSAGNAQMTQFTEAMLRQFSSSGVKRIAQALSNHVHSGENIGSTKEEHIAYITRAQQALAAGGMRMDIWKDMELSKGDLNKLRVETLRTIFNSIGARDSGPTATKKALVEALLTK